MRSGLNICSFYFSGEVTMDTLMRIIQAVAFVSMLVNGCFLDSANYMPFIYRILASAAIYGITGYISNPVSITIED